jgi:hypothetical protein
MSRADQYRHLETEVRARAKETSLALKAEWENLAETYARLAEQSGTDVNPTYDPYSDLLDHTRH